MRAGEGVVCVFMLVMYVCGVVFMFKGFFVCVCGRVFECLWCWE